MTEDTPVRRLDLDQQSHWRALLRGTAALLETRGRDSETATGLSLAAELEHSRSRLTHTVRRMETEGLVGRCSTEGDGRGVSCTLTDAGYARLVDAAPRHVESVRKRLVDVSQWGAAGCARRGVRVDRGRDRGRAVVLSPVPRGVHGTQQSLRDLSHVTHPRPSASAR